MQKSSLDLFFVCALVAVLGLAVRRATMPWCLATGLVLGGLVLTRENALAVAPILAVVLGRAIRPSWRAVAVFAGGVALVLAPVAVRNRVVGGEWHLTTAQFGPNFYIGNNPRASGVYQPLRPGRGDSSVEREDASRMAEQAVGRRLTPGEVSAFWTARALAFIRDHPGAWLRVQGRKALLFVNRVEVGDAEDQYTYGDSSLILRTLGRFLHFGVLIPLAGFGLVIAWMRPGVRVIALVAAVYAATTVLTFVMARYRYPVVPLLLLLAATGLVHAVRGAPGRARIAAGVVVGLALAVVANLTLVTEADVRVASLYNIGSGLAARPETVSLAIDYYRRAIALRPRFALAHGNLGLALGEQGRSDEALAELRQAVELDPRLRRSPLQLGDRRDGGRPGRGRRSVLSPGDRPRPGPRRRAQQSGRSPPAERTGRGGDQGARRRLRDRSERRRRPHQPRRRAGATGERRPGDRAVRSRRRARP
jgi:tetratricopeptide (TPR) repeat protein